jgi:hypothetical protein
VADETKTESPTKKPDPKPAAWLANSIPMRVLVFERERAVPGSTGGMASSITVLETKMIEGKLTQLGKGYTSIELCPSIRQYLVKQNKSPDKAAEFFIHESQVQYAVPLVVP